MLILYIRVARARWEGHVQRMNSTEKTKKMMENTPMERRKAGRSTSIWMDGVL